MDDSYGRYLKDASGKPIASHFDASVGIVLDRLSTLPDLLGVMVYGSVAHGWADSYSDMDFYVLFDTIPPECLRREAYEGLGPPLVLGTEEVTENKVRDDEFDIHFETCRIPLFLTLETHCSASAWVERVIRLEKVSEDDWHNASALQDGLIVRDPERTLSSLRERIHPMPDPIRRFLVADSVERMTDSWPIECAKKSVLRRDRLLTPHLLWALVKAVAHVCLALNGKYYPGDKNLPAHLSRCSALPEDCVQRLVDIISSPDLDQAFQDWICLVLEVLDLVSGVLPEEQTELASKELEWFSEWDGHL